VQKKKRGQRKIASIAKTRFQSNGGEICKVSTLGGKGDQKIRTFFYFP